MQRTCAIEGTACIVLRIMNAEQVLYGNVYKNVHGDVPNNTQPFHCCHHAGKVSKRVMDSTFVQCAFEYIHWILLLHTSPHTEASEKRV